jgi:hypothetical protein
MEKFYLNNDNIINNNIIINYIKNNKCLDNFARFCIIYIFDFHDKIHHDSSINKKPLFIFIEFIQNLMMEGGYIIIFALLTNFRLNIWNYTFQFNKAIILMWGLFYATVHHINYPILHILGLSDDSHTHVQHHLYPTTNYGIDIMDIIFNTKYDLKNIEYFNHASINVIIITFIILYFKIFL